jgi:hypothetical protein
MAQGCEDCGTRLLSSGICPNCDEEVLIFEQESQFNFSDEFMESVSDGEQRAANRKFRSSAL